MVFLKEVDGYIYMSKLRNQQQLRRATGEGGKFFLLRLSRCNVSKEDLTSVVTWQFGCLF
jgi:hypothetical protein